MSFISVFDVMGPNMIGPSSSHTAGAARIALLARKLLTGSLKKVEFTLYGSFAKTYHGHGTDRALLGGIMGFATDDDRAVFSGKINLHTIDPAQAGFSATERFSADHHLLPFFIYHQDIDGIRVYVGFYVVRNERIFDSVICRDLEGTRPFNFCCDASERAHRGRTGSGRDRPQNGSCS